jgi:hypothetical protein
MHQNQSLESSSDWLRQVSPRLNSGLVTAAVAHVAVPCRRTKHSGTECEADPTWLMGPSDLLPGMRSCSEMDSRLFCTIDSAQL